MIIRHVSDNHGSFPESTHAFDFTVMSGDIFPNFVDFHPSDKKREATNQEHWLKRNAQNFVDWAQGKPVFYCYGNHDFLNESSLARETSKLGGNFVNINNQYGGYQDIRMYGFPYIPAIVGRWNYECDDSMQLNHVSNMLAEFNSNGYPDILVCHAPAHGVLDKSPTWDAYHPQRGNHFGLQRLSNALCYTFEQLPRLVLHGHIHEAHGFEVKDFGHADSSKPVLFSNAATTTHYIDYSSLVTPIGSVE